MIAHRMRKPIPVRQYRPDVPPGLALVLEKMMAKNPDERYASAADVAAALAPWLPNPPAGPSEALLPTPASLMAPALPRRRRLSLGWPAAAVFVMLACGAGALAGRWLLSPDAVARTTGSR
jgi:hypothetical protein